MPWDESMTKRLQEIAINADGFAFDPRSGESYRMNDSAQRIFIQLRNGMEPNQIADVLSKEVGQSSEKLFEDVQDFLLQLKLQGLL